VDLKQLPCHCSGVKRFPELERWGPKRLPLAVTLVGILMEETLFDKEKQRKKTVGMQGGKLYVGNLNYSVTNEQLEELFSNHGEVRRVKVY